jgi:hypothetical protein
VHIHFKVRVFSGSSTTHEFNSQLFFDPVLVYEVYATSAYSSRGTPSVANSADNIYGSDGAKLLVQLTPNAAGGYDGTFVVGCPACRRPAARRAPAVARRTASRVAVLRRRAA